MASRPPPETCWCPIPVWKQRRFVLEPLAELAPSLVLPSGNTVLQSLAQVGEQAVKRIPTDGEGRVPSRICGSGMDYSAIQAEIRELAREKQAVILAHNYQRPEVQDVADILGDSLGLSQQAAATKARMIVFCGVHFMAETAAILSPDRPVILPEPRAGCPMADMVDVPGLEALKAQHPGAVVVSYVNTTAAVKAISDVCCTSANAVKVVKTIEAGREIIFTPDVNLGSWVAKKTGREMILWPGFCPTHDLIEVSDIETGEKGAPTGQGGGAPGVPSRGGRDGRRRGEHVGYDPLLSRGRRRGVPHRDGARDDIPALQGYSKQALLSGDRGQCVPEHEAHHPRETPRRAHQRRTGGQRGS